MEEKVLLPAQNQDYRNFIVKYNQNLSGTQEYESNGLFQIINEYFAVLYVPKENAPALEVNGYSYPSIPNCYTYMDLDALQAAGVTRLNDHPYLRLRGNGTLIAVIDSGIDYLDPLFLDGSTSRILAIWDQTIPGDGSDLAPYGKVFLKEDLDQALKSENPLEYVPSRDDNGHGTRLAAVAAGNRIPAENFSGAAPEAAIVVVKLKPAKEYLKDFYLYPEQAEVFQEDDIMLGISFAQKCAKKFRRPLSICLGLGTNQGAHQGTSPLCQYIDYTSSFLQNVVSVAAGNEGAARHHYAGQLDQLTGETEVELRIGEGERGFCTEFWGLPPETYELSLQTPTGERLRISTALRAKTQELSFVFVETKVEVNYIATERLTGYTLVFFRFLNPVPGVWKVLVRGSSNERSSFHMWLPVTGLISENTYFLESSPYDTITSPGDGREGMTVTAYNYMDNSLYLLASRGFLTDGSISPTFAVPGVNLRIPKPDGTYDIVSGTSLSAAMNAGISALIFEWTLIRENEPFFQGTGVKFYLQKGAVREPDRRYPNPEWGFGRIDLYKSFELFS